MKIDAELIGLDDIARMFDSKVNKLNKAMQERMTDVTLDLLQKSVELAPVKTGYLRQSSVAKVNGTIVARGTKEGNIVKEGMAPVKSDEMTGEVGFSAEYAFKQHEDLSLEHDTGRSKYLETPFDQNIDRYMSILEKGVYDAMKGDD